MTSRAPASPGADTIFTVVSREGPVEARILEALAPRLVAHRRIGGDVSLRTLESVEHHPGPRVVLLHGRGHAATLWAPIAMALAEKRDVVAVDLPGFGHSGAPELGGAGPEDGLAFFRDPVERLLSDGKPTVLVGHSLGGLVALDLALRARVDVKALVLVDAMGLGPTVSLKSRLYLRAGPEALARVRAAFRRGGAAPPEGALAALAGDEGAVREELLRLRTELLTTRGGRGAASRAFNAMLSLDGARVHRRDLLGHIAIPTLLLWGEADDGFPLPVAIEAKARMPTATLVTLPTGHSPHVEAPLRTLAVMARFLDEL